MGKVKVNVEDIERALAVLDACNEIPFDDLVLIVNGEHIQPPQDLVENWKYFGLNNVSFIKKLLRG